MLLPCNTSQPNGVPYWRAHRHVIQFEPIASCHVGRTTASMRWTSGDQRSDQRSFTRSTGTAGKCV